MADACESARVTCARPFPKLSANRPNSSSKHVPCPVPLIACSSRPIVWPPSPTPLGFPVLFTSAIVSNGTTRLPAVASTQGSNSNIEIYVFKTFDVTFDQQRCKISKKRNHYVDTSTLSKTPHCYCRGPLGLIGLVMTLLEPEPLTDQEILR